MHIGVDMNGFAQKAPFDLILLFEKRYWDCTLEECLTATSICPLFPSFFLPFHPCPHPTAHSRTQVFIKAKGLTLKQSLPLILAWLLRPPICSQCAWYRSAAASPLIKTDIDRRMWISSAIMCLLKIITVFFFFYSTAKNKRKLLREPRSKVTLYCLPSHFCTCRTWKCPLWDALHPPSWLYPAPCRVHFVFNTARFSSGRQVVRVKRCHPLCSITQENSRNKQIRKKWNWAMAACFQKFNMLYACVTPVQPYEIYRTKS